MAEMENSADGQVSPTALLFLVVGEPFTNEFKELILQRITKGLIG